MIIAFQYFTIPGFAQTKEHIPTPADFEIHAVFTDTPNFQLKT
ncbi:hypothetical protein [Rhodohalobacter sp.]|nr:hypothetical protein [Rhodohalobacter sp.]MDZ7756437.1 hypothetical protein [Rhodohalobacter sp.]